MHESIEYEKRGSHPPKQPLPIPSKKKLACDGLRKTYRRHRILHVSSDPLRGHTGTAGKVLRTFLCFTACRSAVCGDQGRNSKHDRQDPPRHFSEVVNERE